MTNFKPVLVILFAALLSQSASAYGPRHGYGGRPDFYRPAPRPITFVCETYSNGRGPFFGVNPNEGEAKRLAHVACNSAGRTGLQSCWKNIRCSIR